MLSLMLCLKLSPYAEGSAVACGHVWISTMRSNADKAFLKFCMQ